MRTNGTISSSSENAQHQVTTRYVLNLDWECVQSKESMQSLSLLYHDESRKQEARDAQQRYQSDNNSDNWNAPDRDQLYTRIC